MSAWSKTLMFVLPSLKPVYAFVEFMSPSIEKYLNVLCVGEVYDHLHSGWA